MRSIAPNGRTASRRLLSRFGRARWRDITTVDVLAVLKPLWTAGKHETAARLRSRIERAIEVARSEGAVPDDKPNGPGSIGSPVSRFFHGLTLPSHLTVFLSMERRASW
jgi:hypothetical protein